MLWEPAAGSRVYHVGYWPAAAPFLLQGSQDIAVTDR